MCGKDVSVCYLHREGLSRRRSLGDREGSVSLGGVLNAPWEKSVWGPHGAEAGLWSCAWVRVLWEPSVQSL